MRNSVFSLLALILLAAVAFSALAAERAAAADSIIVQVNGRPLDLDVPPLIEAGRALVPMRAIAESLGAFVGWDAVARRVTILFNKDELTLVIDNDIAYMNDLPRQLDAPARIVDGRTLVPARFISESLHAEVDWNDVTRTVIITTYEDTAPYSAALAQLEEAVLQELNLRRARLARATLTPVEELRQMARSHAAELAQAGSFTHISPRFGDTASRAAARGLTVHFEYLAYGLPDAVAITDALLRGEYGARLLAEEALFCGLGLYKATEAGNADIYVVAELIEGTGLIQGPRLRRLDIEEFTLNGYATTAAPLTLYLLNEEGNYISRYGYTLSVDGAGRFSLRLNLPQPGHYAVVVGQDSVLLIYE
jgi:uncharacterized protein YkwD